MSIILEALRKSEAARRRSEAPDVFTPMPSAAAHTPQRRHPSVLAITAAASLVVLSGVIAIWWLSGNPNADRQDIAPPVGQQAQHADSGARIAPPIASAQPPTAIAPAQPSPPPAPTRSPIATAPAPSTAISTPAPVVAAASGAARTSTVQAAPVSDPVSRPSASGATSSGTTSSGSATMPPPASMTMPTHASPAPDRALPPRSGPDESPLHVSDLDPGTRRQLPPLKLSMHLWDESPSRRFLIIDGQRLKEGDMHGEIVIERIEREGAILVWRGTRMRIDVR